MSLHIRNPPLLNIAPFWGGISAIGILCVLAIWSVGSGAAYGINDLERSSVVVALDNPLHASGDYSLSIKRFYSRHQDQRSTVKLPEPFWSFPSAELNSLLLVFFAGQKHFYRYSPCVCLHQLQVLNVPRAPPLA